MKSVSSLGLFCALLLNASCESPPAAAPAGVAEPAQAMAQHFLSSIIQAQGIQDLVAEPTSHFMFPFRLFLAGPAGHYSEELPTQLFPNAAPETLSSFSTDQYRLSAFCIYLQEQDPGLTRLPTYDLDAIYALAREGRPVLHVLGVGYNQDKSEYLVCYRIFSAVTGTQTHLELFNSDRTGSFQVTTSHSYKSSG